MRTVEIDRLAANERLDGHARHAPTMTAATAFGSTSLAHRAAMSPRNFARVFTRETGQTPAKFVERTRVEEARRMLEESNGALETIATDCGLGSGERMRRTFLRHLGASPLEYRRRFVPRGAATEMAP